VSYLVSGEQENACIIKDSGLDYDVWSGRTSTHSAEATLPCFKNFHWPDPWILENHIHTDHISNAAYWSKNLNAGVISPAATGGPHYLKTPLNCH